MPVLSMFYGIIIRMYYFDDRQHHAPHVHAQYADHRGVLGIEDGMLLAGYLPPGKVKLVQAWIEIHRDELLANWHLALNGDAMFRVDPRKWEATLNPYVRHVRPREDYCLELEFDNGEHRVFDVRPYLQRGVFARLQNVALFQAARVVAGSVEWPGGIDLSYDTLYVESTPAPTPVTEQVEEMG